MSKPGNREEAALSLNRRTELFLSDVWVAMDAHGIDKVDAAYVLSGTISDLLWEQTSEAIRSGE